MPLNYMKEDMALMLLMALQISAQTITVEQVDLEQALQLLQEASQRKPNDRGTESRAEEGPPPEAERAAAPSPHSLLNSTVQSWRPVRIRGCMQFR